MKMTKIMGGCDYRSPLSAGSGYDPSTGAMTIISIHI